MSIQPRLDRDLDDMIAEAHTIIDGALAKWKPVSVWAAFSGGNDSTVMLDIIRRHPAVNGVLHVDTTIGIRATRQFVRDVSAQWAMKLHVVQPRMTFRERMLEPVLRCQGCGARWKDDGEETEHTPNCADPTPLWGPRGFFGPSDHEWAYRLLKKDAVRVFKKQMLEPRKSSRLMLLTGMRAHESKTRLAHGSDDRLEERIAWVNPIRHWTNDDMAEYRLRYPSLPHNPVNKALGKSGECLCGCFSYGPVELEIIRDLDPETADEIEQTQADLKALGSPFCRWGPGGQATGRRAGPMCVGCDELALSVSS